MDFESLFRTGSFRSLISVVLTNRTLRNTGLKFIERKIREVLVNENVDGRPVQVQQDKCDYLSAMLRSACHNIERGLISKHVLDRVLTVFLDSVICNTEALIQAEERLGLWPPLFVAVSPTAKCNLRCTGCYAGSSTSSSAQLDWETFDRILREKEEQWASYFTVISGGEPFLWEDGGRTLLDIAAKHSSNLFLVYTNGTLIGADLAKRLEELANVTPAISVEGFEAETDRRRGKGVHRRILRAFECLREVGVPFGISVTATRENWDVVTSDQFADFYFEEQGALYGWIFQYMPIGRGQSLELMVPPRERLEMLERTWRMVRERKLFIADFWNSGTLSNGCIAAGRPGGYLYINWDGNVTPCVFMPYADTNIHTVYRNGGDLSTVLASPLCKRIRHWQGTYGYEQPVSQVHNWLCPCAIRDHFGEFLESCQACGGRPIDADAQVALNDAEYHRGMIQYGRRFGQMTDSIWDERYMSVDRIKSGAELITQADREARSLV
jgi:MoaA/NifB/PqqE/SkfB family radical SAM enzyme